MSRPKGGPGEEALEIVLVGYGRMGRAVESVALERGHRVRARLTREANPGGRGLATGDLDGARVAVDFSVGEAVLPNVRAAAGRGLDVVVGATGWEEDLPSVREAVEEAGTGLVHAPNFSTGVHLFLRLAREAARLAARVEGYDVHAAEAHHRHKRDHPGGTARRLAELLVEELPGKEGWSEHLPPDGPLDPSVLHLSVTRVGEEPGTHLLGLDGPDDRIEIRHSARGRGGFARGAVLAAEWVAGRKGVFTMDHILEERLSRTGRAE